MNKEYIDYIDRYRHSFNEGYYKDKLLNIIEEKFENTEEITINDFTKFYEEIERDFKKSLSNALDEFTKKKKVFLNCYDKDEKKIYVGDNVIYHRRIRKLTPANVPEIKGEVPHGKDDEGNDLYYYTTKKIRLKGKVNYGLDKFGYHTNDYISLNASGNYKPFNHYVEKRLRIGKKDNGRYIYDDRKIYTDIELIGE